MFYTCRYMRILMMFSFVLYTHTWRRRQQLCPFTFCIRKHTNMHMKQQKMTTNIVTHTLFDCSKYTIHRRNTHAHISVFSHFALSISLHFDSFHMYLNHVMQNYVIYVLVNILNTLRNCCAFFVSFGAAVWFCFHFPS